MKYTEIDADTLAQLIEYAARTTQGTTDGQPILDRAKNALHRAEAPTRRRTLHDICQDAIEEFKDRIANYDGDEDAIGEIADSFVPIYNYDLLMLAAEDMSILLDESEIGTPTTPLEALQWNTYERISAALWKYWNERAEADDSDADTE